MDDFCNRAAKLINELKFNDLLSAFKSKSKTLSVEELEYFIKLSLSKNLHPLTLLILNLYWKGLKRVPMNKWDQIINITSEFLNGVAGLIPENLIKSLFQLCRRFGQTISELGNSFPEYTKLALSTLLRVLEITNKKEEITPIHSLVCKIALMSKKLFEVEDFIGYDYLQVMKNVGVKGESCVTFFYYIASIALILKKYSRAIHFYDLAITVPSKSIHAASVESYKKQVLLKLFLEGSEYHIPRSASGRFHNVTRHPSCEFYTQLANFVVDFIKGKGSKEIVYAHINKGRSIYTSDKNQGLIKKVKDSVIKHKIKRLTKVYASLTFEQIAKEISEGNAEEIVINMIENREINGKLDMKNKSVAFYDSENRVEIDEVQDVCEKLMKNAEAIEVRLEEISLDPRYLKQLVFSEGFNKTG